jgi:hypothetical protein
MATNTAAIPESDSSSPANTSTNTPCEWSFHRICFVRPPAIDRSIFGFTEFVTAFALLMLVYTLSDVRYRFRIAVSPIPLFRATYFLLIFIGTGTLVTSVWFAERWPLPAALADLSLWQGFFGLLFFALALTWLWYAFMRAPIFGKRNARKYAQELYFRILQGSEADLPIIADELARSARSIVKLFSAPRRNAYGRREAPKPDASGFAHDIMLMIANRKLRRHIVSSSPGTAMVFFGAMTDQRKYEAPMGQFAANLSTEALLNKDSIIYHEDQGYTSGFFGYLKPFSTTVYGDYELVETLVESGRSPLDVDYQLVSSWDAKQGQGVLPTRAYYICRLP